MARRARPTLAQSHEELPDLSDNRVGKKEKPIKTDSVRIHEGEEKADRQ
jgi:hypothetical protein